MKIIRLSKLTAISVGIVIGVISVLGIQSAKGTNSSNTALLEELRIYAEVLEKTKQAYVEKVDDKKLVESSIRGMLSNLDPHSDYFSRSDFQQLQQDIDGVFCGIGIEIEPDHQNHAVTIVAPIEGSPAQKAGVKSGDLIVKIDHKATSGMSLSEIVQSIRGKPRTKVTITIIRKNLKQPIDFVITREMIRGKSVRFSLLEKDYGYLRITQFQTHTHQDLVSGIQALYEQNKKPLKGLVLDLRDNPGGLLNSAIGISAVFLPKDSLVLHIKGRSSEDTVQLYASEQYYKNPDQKGDINKKLPQSVKKVPLIVLINSGSASASEIVAGALQDHHRSHIIGTRSFGKGSVQTTIPLSNGGVIKLTVAYYFTPKNRSIQAKGIDPDTVVEDETNTSFVERLNIREANLSGHLNNPHGSLSNQQEKEQASLQKPAHSPQSPQSSGHTNNHTHPNIEEDHQLKQALIYLKNPSSDHH